MQAFINYLRDVRSELTHVSWPSRSQAIGYTVLVIAMCIVTALILGAADFVFTYLLEKIVTL
jgi:preprotein translocase subunit SecE